MHGFLETLRVQRWDDHRYYHHSRINQTLHLISAISFLCAYVLVFTDPAAAALIGWLVSMTTRQAGHFFFEPKGYDHINQATHEHKEEIKVGYNLQRKVVLLSIWAASPLMLLVNPTLFGVFEPHQTIVEFIRHVGLIWLALGVGGLLFRTVHLFFIKDVQSGLVWMTKILTDPFHDVMLYYKAPYYLLQGELIDPKHAQHGDEIEELEDEVEPEPALRG
jgi:type IV secretory pathway VirB3-like protein